MVLTGRGWPTSNPCTSKPWERCSARKRLNVASSSGGEGNSPSETRSRSAPANGKSDSSGRSSTSSARRSGPATSVPPPKLHARKSRRRVRLERSVTPPPQPDAADAAPRRRRERLRLAGVSRNSARSDAPEKAYSKQGRPCSTSGARFAISVIERPVTDGRDRCLCHAFKQSASTCAWAERTVSSTTALARRSRPPTKRRAPQRRWEASSEGRCARHTRVCVCVCGHSSFAHFILRLRKRTRHRERRIQADDERPAAGARQSRQPTPLRTAG